MGRMLYLECASGISGDMTVAALLDAGADEAALHRALDSLPVDGFSVRVSRVEKSGLDACDFAVLLDDAHENHDHDMDYLHSADWPHGRDVAAGHAHHVCEHDAAAGHAHGGCGTHGARDAPDAPVSRGTSDLHHAHRGLPEICAIIDAANMTDRAKGIARRTFEVLAAAEAKAHGVPLDEVHFHEVGAVDSIADVIAAAVCFDSLGVDEVVVPVLCDGRGTVRCQHGVIPVPVPAVVNIVADVGIPLRILDVQGELVTPTGAAFVAAVRTRDRLPDRFVVERVGIGAGKRLYETPGILRAFLIRADETDGESGESFGWGKEFEKS